MACTARWHIAPHAILATSLKQAAVSLVLADLILFEVLATSSAWLLQPLTSHHACLWKTCAGAFGGAELREAVPWKCHASTAFPRTAAIAQIFAEAANRHRTERAFHF